MKRIISVAATMLLGNTVLASATTREWNVAKISGQAWSSSSAGERTPLSINMGVAQGTSIETGDRSRVLLLRGTEQMIVGPKSLVALATPATEELDTTVLEKTGSVTFDVNRQDVQHFSVETPLLAAVVKGTRFTVTVGKAKASLAVDRGAVEVTSLATGQTAVVSKGQRASVGTGRQSGLGLSGIGRMPAITQGPPRSPRMSQVQHAEQAVAFSASIDASPAQSTAAANNPAPITTARTRCQADSEEGCSQ